MLSVTLYLVNTNTLSFLMTARGLSQSEVARLAGVSRQAVSIWFGGKKTKFVNVHLATMLKLSAAMRISVDDLVKPIAALENPQMEENLRVEFLWDRLYPSLGTFVSALLRHDKRAIARLVQCVGFFEGAKLIGKVVWRTFHSYKQFIIPVRRNALESLWIMQKSLDLI